MMATVEYLAFEGPFRTAQVRFSDQWKGVFVPGDDLWKDRGGHVLPPHVVAMLDAEWTPEVRKAYAAHVAEIEKRQRIEAANTPAGKDVIAELTARVDELAAALAARK